MTEKKVTAIFHQSERQADEAAEKASETRGYFHPAEFLEAAGEALYGDRWQTAIARDLDVSDRTVRNWNAMKFAIPDGVQRDILALLSAREVEIARVRGGGERMLEGGPQHAGVFISSPETTFIFNENWYDSSAEMHDAIAWQWIGAGASPDLADVENILENWVRYVAEIEGDGGWGLAGNEESDPLHNYHRAELKAAVERLRDRLANSDEEEDEE